MLHILRHFNILNIVLFCMLGMIISYGLLPLSGRDFRITAPSVKKTEEAPVEKQPEKEASPAAADFMVIADRNLFHPDRVIPVEKKEEKPLPKPDFVLYGTLIDVDMKKAFMDDLKVPYTTPGRGKRQRVLKQGDNLSGFTLREVMVDRVVMVRGEERIEVKLDDQKSQRGKAGDTAATAPAATKQPPTAAKPAETATQRQAPAQVQQQPQQPAQTFRPSPQDMRQRFRSIKR